MTKKCSFIQNIGIADFIKKKNEIITVPIFSESSIISEGLLTWKLFYKFKVLHFPPVFKVGFPPINLI